MTEHDGRPAAPRPPFGPEFFETVLRERVEVECRRDPSAVAGVWLHVADGRTLDVCHVVALEPAWLAVRVFRDREQCDDMDTVFLPYGLITRVTVTLDRSTARRVGFGLPPADPERTGAVDVGVA